MHARARVLSCLLPVPSWVGEGGVGVEWSVPTQPLCIAWHAHCFSRVCLHSLWKTSGYDELYTHIAIDKSYRISGLYQKHLSTACKFSNVDKSAFLNINTPENLDMAQALANTLKL